MAVRKVAAVELVACHVFNLVEQTRQLVTYGDVEAAGRAAVADFYECAVVGGPAD